MARSALVNAGGVLALDELLVPSCFDALRCEGLGLRPSAMIQRKDQPDPGGWRAGNPARYLATAESGPVLEAIYSDSGLIDRIEGLTGQKLKPTGDRGSYSFYDRPGHYLGLHRDIRTCDVTLIICIDRKGPKTPVSALRVYSKAIKCQLEDITPGVPHNDFSMRKGQSLLFLGGLLPHEVLPAVEGFSRSVAVLCYEVLYANRP